MSILKEVKVAFVQFIRYGFVGLALNLAGYFLYLLVTWLGLEPKLAVTFFYPIGVLCGYFAHKNLSFRHTVGVKNYRLIVNYFLVSAIGYIINVGLIELFHDLLSYPHQIVQACAIFIVGGFLFFAMKLFVFAGTSD